jgi:hypothetical protein
MPKTGGDHDSRACLRLRGHALSWHAPVLLAVKTGLTSTGFAMRPTTGMMLWMLVVGAIAEAAYGDGEFFVRERVPADVPDQRESCSWESDSLRSMFRMSRAPLMAT